MDGLRDMIELALSKGENRTNLVALAAQVQTMVQNQGPNTDTVIRAVQLGDAGVVRAMLQSPKLTREERGRMATEALLSWCDNPLASRQPEILFGVLVEQGADLSAKAPRSPTIAERVAERLGRIEGNERRMKVAGTLKFSTAPCKILGQCWDAMVKSGADLVSAGQVRLQSGRLVAPVVSTKPQKPAGEVVAGFGGLVSPGRLGPGSMR